MATAVIMPRQGQSVESCVIGTWHKKPGDKVSVGDLLFTYETDKATFEEESKVEGTLLALFFEEGDDVECLINVCVIGSEGESFDEFRPSGQGDGPQRQGDGSLVSGGQDAGHGDGSSVSGGQGDGSFVSSPVSGNAPISPRARKLAERAGADIARAVPTGANGRIMERDIQKVIDAGFLGTRSALGSLSGATPTGLGGRVTAHDLANAQAHGRPLQAARSFDVRDLARLKGLGDSNFEDVKLSGVRKFISGAMHASLANSAQLTHHSSFDASDILDFRKKLKSLKNDDDVLSKISVTDIIIYAVSRVIAGHKSFNAHFLGDSMRFFDNVHIGVAVDTPRGLLVPTVGYANTLGLADISLFMKNLISSSREGSVEPDFLKGGTFTISNLGAMGVEMFTPILNPPQTGILGVCSIVERLKNGKFYPAMGLSLTYDHRALDGADAARFQKDLVDYLENFSFNLTVERGM